MVLEQMTPANLASQGQALGVPPLPCRGFYGAMDAIFMLSSAGHGNPSNKAESHRYLCSFRLHLLALASPT